MERIKLPCPLEIVKNIGKEALWMVQQARNIQKLGIIGPQEPDTEEWLI